MRRAATAAGLLLAAGLSLAAEPLPPLEEYLGSSGCQTCHADKYAGWTRTYHSTVIQDARKNPGAILGDFSSSGLTVPREQVEYAIGGHWTQRYLVRQGDELYALPKLWSVASRKWEPTDAWTWKKKPYSVFCVGCHVTRYDPQTRTYAEHAIACETCHGPGRSHARSGGTAAIVNPAKLGADGQDLLCASCHVRGTDPSETYQFPVGFVPGRALEDYYLPGNLAEGESPREGLLRQFRAWRDKMRSGSSECEVCGLYGDKGKKEPKTVTEYCMGCHKFGEGYSAHTHHDAAVNIECGDCHRKVEVEQPAGADVHSLGFYQVHNQTCYSRDFAKACAACHGEFTPDRVASQLVSWRTCGLAHN